MSAATGAACTWLNQGIVLTCKEIISPLVDHRCQTEAYLTHHTKNVATCTRESDAKSSVSPEFQIWFYAIIVGIHVVLDVIFMMKKMWIHSIYST